jgi:uncharacterized surface protein with fasciclin (FAS1) repeats
MAVSIVSVLLFAMGVTCSSLNIVQTASADTQFSVLVEALTKANLVDTLNGNGPFTVFAPTNTAFTNALAALKITKAQLLAKDDLADILKYHVLPVKVPSSALQASQTPTTVQGLKVMVTKTGSAVKFASATVTSADITCDNGIIHVIDKVVLPPTLNIVQTAAASPDFSVLVEAVKKANLVDTLSGTGKFTLFAPTNAAFVDALAALKITKVQLLARSDLADILKYHVLQGEVTSSALKASQTPATVQGQKVKVTKAGAVVKFASATVTSADLGCSNGVIHTINKVVLPPRPETSSGAESKFRSVFLAMVVAAAGLTMS